MKLTPKQKIFLRFLLSYLILLAIPAVMGTVLYYQTLGIATDNLRRHNRSLLQQCSEILDAVLAETERLAQHVSTNTSILELRDIDNAFQPATMARLIKFTSSLPVSHRAAE